jgi:hypothetical protein
MKEPIRKRRNVRGGAPIFGFQKSQKGNYWFSKQNSFSRRFDPQDLIGRDHGLSH